MNYFKLFCLDALRALETINDGKGLASPAGVPPHAPAPPSPIQQRGMVRGDL